jgi:hypothetical protein
MFGELGGEGPKRSSNEGSSASSAMLGLPKLEKDEDVSRLVMLVSKPKLGGTKVEETEGFSLSVMLL